MLVPLFPINHKLNSIRVCIAPVAEIIHVRLSPVRAAFVCDYESIYSIKIFAKLAA